MGRRIFWGLFSGLVSCTTPTQYTSCQVCPTTNVIDMHEGPEDPRDRLAFDRATWRCGQNAISKCLIQFTRFEPGTYAAICGQQRRTSCPVTTELE